MPWLILAALLLALESIVPRRPFRRKHAALATLGLLSVAGSFDAEAQTDARSNLIEGTNAFRESRFEDATLSFGEAAKEKETAAQALYNQGCALLASGEHEAASSAFSRALEHACLLYTSDAADE